MAANMLKSFVRTFWILNLLPSHLQGQKTKTYFDEYARITISCNNPIESPSAIVWESKNRTIAVYKTKDEKLSDVLTDLTGRIDILPRGDIIITNVSRQDSDIYKCVKIKAGGRNEPDVWHELIVNAKPEDLQLFCSANVKNEPNEECSNIKREAIRALKCTATSYPETPLLWSSPPECSNNETNEEAKDREKIGNIFKQSSTIKTLCSGTYCCKGDYLNMEQPPVKCVTVGASVTAVSVIDVCSSSPCSHGDCIENEGQYHCICYNGYTGENCENKKSQTTTVIIVIIVVSLLLTVIVIIIVIFIVKKRRNAQRQPSAPLDGNRYRATIKEEKDKWVTARQEPLKVRFKDQEAKSKSRSSETDEFLDDNNADSSEQIGQGGRDDFKTAVESSKIKESNNSSNCSDTDSFLNDNKVDSSEEKTNDDKEVFKTAFDGRKLK